MPQSKLSVFIIIDWIVPVNILNSTSSSQASSNWPSFCSLFFVQFWWHSLLVELLFTERAVFGWKSLCNRSLLQAGHTQECVKLATVGHEENISKYCTNITDTCKTYVNQEFTFMILQGWSKVLRVIKQTKYPDLCIVAQRVGTSNYGSCSVHYQLLFLLLTLAPCHWIWTCFWRINDDFRSIVFPPPSAPVVRFLLWDVIGLYIGLYWLILIWFYKRTYERLYIWCAEKDVKTLLIIVVIYTIYTCK